MTQLFLQALQNLSKCQNTSTKVKIHKTSKAKIEIQSHLPDQGQEVKMNQQVFPHSTDTLGKQDLGHFIIHVSYIHKMSDKTG